MGSLSRRVVTKCQLYSRKDIFIMCTTCVEMFIPAPAETSTKILYILSFKFAPIPVTWPSFTQHVTEGLALSI